MPRPSNRRGAVRPSRAARRTALAFRRGEAGAVEEVRLYVRRILTFRRLGIDPSSLPDLEQQVMTEVWRAALKPGFDPAAGFWGFVETVTARRCIDQLRTARPTDELPESVRDARESPLEELLADERLRLARRVLAQLPAPCRELIELHTARRLTYREIAPILGRSEGALRVQMHRCVEAARRRLADSDRAPIEMQKLEELER